MHDGKIQSLPIDIEEASERVKEHVKPLVGQGHIKSLLACNLNQQLLDHFQAHTPNRKQDATLYAVRSRDRKRERKCER